MALAGLMSFGVSVFSFDMAPAEAAAQRYEDGTSNEHSHRLREEDARHEQNVHETRDRYRRGEHSAQRYEEEMRKEQRRHDHEVERIRGDYESRRHNNY